MKCDTDYVTSSEVTTLWQYRNERIIMIIITREKFGHWSSFVLLEPSNSSSELEVTAVTLTLIIWHVCTVGWYNHCQCNMWFWQTPCDCILASPVEVF